jgi:lipoate synthase
MNWANDAYKRVSTDMNHASKKIISAIIQKSIPDFDEDIQDISVACGYGEINVFAEINNKIIMIVMNKATYTEQKRLQLYRKLQELYSTEHTGRKLITIHYPHKEESQEFLEQIKDMGWTIITKGEYIEIVHKYRDVLVDNVLDKILDD